MTEQELLEREFEEIEGVCSNCKETSKIYCIMKCFYSKRLDELFGRLKELKELKMRKFYVEEGIRGEETVSIQETCTAEEIKEMLTLEYDKLSVLADGLDGLHVEVTLKPEVLCECVDDLEACNV